MSSNNRISKQNPELEMGESSHQEWGDSKEKSSGLIMLSSFFAPIINWLVAPFMLTEEEKQEAGIYIGRLGKDE
ncbi:hypothetical protein KQH40_01475 [bacterium]|nr:hypothetical protein [bacterium]